jgi:DNA-binding transcriptional LysR family regulator
MDGEQIRSFIRVAEAGSFAKAEAGAFVTRQALKKQVDALERDLGFRLLTRTHKGVALTPAGAKFFDGIQPIMADFQALQARCKGAAARAGTVTVANPPHPRPILGKAFDAFSQRYPRMKLNIVYTNVKKTIGYVLDGTVDAAEAVLYPTDDRSLFGCYKIADLTYHCLMAGSHALARKRVVRYEDLAGTAVGIRGNGNEALIADIHARCPGVALSKTSGQEANSIFTFCYNQGVFLSRAHYARAFEPFVAVPLETGIAHESFLVYSLTPSPAALKFIQTVKELYPACLSA